VRCWLYRNLHFLHCFHHARPNPHRLRHQIHRHQQTLVTQSQLHPNYPETTAIETTSIGSANSAIRHDTIPDRIAFYHATLFSPSLATWCDAIDNGHFTAWPDLTSALVRKHAPKSIAMLKGHLDQQRSNQHSTQPPKPPTSESPTPDTTELSNTTPATPSEAPLKRSHFVFADCQPLTGQIYTDQTGRFLPPSSAGNSYLLILYDFDSNSIHAEPMKSRSATEILSTYTRAHTLLSS
jgi:hypothetical protein